MARLPHNPIDLLFGGMGKLGPGDDDETLKVLRLLPRRGFPVVVDAGCGTGRQTLVLARQLGTAIEAVDSYEPFLNDLNRRSKDAGIEKLVRTHCMDMKDIPSVFPRIDLLWSEGAAYNIGFSNALTIWAAAIEKDGFLVASELSWIHPRVPASVREFFRTGYPEMRSVEQNVTLAEDKGYKVLHTHLLPKKAWVKGYYDVLKPRAESLGAHTDSAVRDFALETLKEIEVFESSEDSYGYVFYVLRRA